MTRLYLYTSLDWILYTMPIHNIIDILPLPYSLRIRKKKLIDKDTRARGVSFD